MKTDADYTDYPFEQLAKTIARVRLHGGNAYLKFTCDECGSRLTIDSPNVLHATGNCEECGAITNIEAKGGNLLVVLPYKQK